MLYRILPLLLIFGLASFGAAAATDTQRSRFLEAERALQSGDMSRFATLKARLADYPLLPYLDYAELRRNLATASPSRVRAFLEHHADTPLATRLRGAWLHELAQQARWDTFLEFFRPTTYTVRRCQYLNALIATGHGDTAHRQVEQLWLSGRSQPKACDPVFDNWRAAGGLTGELVWQRVELAMEAGQARLARYLKRYLPAAERPWVDLWIEVRSEPAVIRDPVKFAKAHPKRADILLYGLGRLGRTDAEATAAAWRELAQRFDFSPSQSALGERIVALSYIRHEHPLALQRAGGISPGDDIHLHHKRLLTALTRGEWATALGWIDGLPPQEREEERWRYWKARALEQLGRKDEALALYTAISQDRTYYAFLAADRLGAAYFLQNIPLSLPAGELAQIETRPAARRARELRLLERGVDARREWRWLTRQMDDDSLKAAALLAKRWNWHDQAIFTLARSGYWDDLELRFPLEHLALAEEHAERQNIELPWVLAVMRQESAFAHDAVSRAGARGLMQLMPATARQTARRLGRKKPGRHDLLQPETNIPLGTAYLSQVLESLDRHPVLATAAYNAGPNRVKRWLPERTLDADVWVETIPFRETRDYVKRVMAYAVIYEKRLGQQPGSILARMRPISGVLDKAAKVEAAADGNSSG